MRGDDKCMDGEEEWEVNSLFEVFVEILIHKYACAGYGFE